MTDIPGIATKRILRPILLWEFFISDKVEERSSIVLVSQITYVRVPSCVKLEAKRAKIIAGCASLSRLRGRAEYASVAHQLRRISAFDF